MKHSYREYYPTGEIRVGQLPQRVQAVTVPLAPLIFSTQFCITRYRIIAGYVELCRFFCRKLVQFNTIGVILKKSYLVYKITPAFLPMIRGPPSEA